MQIIRPDMDIGHNIQRLRRNASMTQGQVVARLQLIGIEFCISKKYIINPRRTPNTIQKTKNKIILLMVAVNKSIIDI